MPRKQSPLGLSPSEYELLSLLMRRTVVSKESCAVVLGNWQRGTPNARTVHSFMGAMRKKLTLLQIEVQTVDEQGYRLSPETKDKVRALMREEGLVT